MTISLEGFPGDQVTADLTDSAATLAVDATLYPLQALYGAAYTFIDRCFVLLDRPEPTRFRVTLSPKKAGGDAAALRALAGEFVNELLSCAWRFQITQENRAIIEAVTSQALAGAMGPPSLDELESFDFTEESFDDPLGIAMSWEEKYKKPKAGAADAGGGQSAAPAAAGGGDEAVKPAEGPKPSADAAGSDAVTTASTEGAAGTAGGGEKAP